MQNEVYVKGRFHRLIHDANDEPNAPKAICLMLVLMYTLNAFAMHYAGVINLWTLLP